MSSTARGSSGRMVEVRLSQVPQDLRRRIADLIVERGALAGVPALELTLAAMIPRQDPKLLVSEEKADLVLRGKQPRGDMPRVWEW